MNGDVNMVAMVGGLIRTVLAVVGGYFVSRGKIAPDDVNTISGAVLALLSAGWSVVNHKNDPK